MALSWLQKAILEYAAKNGQAVNGDILEHVYGFAPLYPFPKSRAKRFEATPAKKAAAVATCKAFDRLAARGLVVRHYGFGVEITKAGRRAVRG